MSHKITVQQVVDHFAGVEELFVPIVDPVTNRSYIYAEVGQYKPFHGATLTALRKRGYRVEKCSYRGRIVPDCYYIYEKEEAHETA